MKNQKTEQDFDSLIGTGSGLINPNSADFQKLREHILEHSSGISEEEKMKIRILGLQFRMRSYLEESSPETLIPAGHFLRELVEIIKVPHKEFAAYIGIKNSNLSALYRGDRKINYDIAIKLGQIFETDPTLWLNLQNKTEILQIRNQGKKEYKKYHLNDLLKKAG